MDILSGLADALQGKRPLRRLPAPRATQKVRRRELPCVTRPGGRRAASHPAPATSAGLGISGESRSKGVSVRESGGVLAAKRCDVQATERVKLAFVEFSEHLVEYIEHALSPYATGCCAHVRLVVFNILNTGRRSVAP